MYMRSFIPSATRFSSGWDWCFLASGSFFSLAALLMILATSYNNSGMALTCVLVFLYACTHLMFQCPFSSCSEGFLLLLLPTLVQEVQLVLNKQDETNLISVKYFFKPTAAEGSFL